MKHRIAAALFVLVSLASYAQSGQWEFRFGPRFWGANVAARYMMEPPSIAGVETSITGRLSAAYEDVGYFRLPNGALFVVPNGDFAASSTNYQRADLVWEAGLRQGILPRSDSTDDLAVAFLFYRGQYNLPFPNDSPLLFFASDRPETEGSLRGSLVGGLAISNIITDEVTRVRRGAAAEIAFEWGPSFLHNQVLSSADYSRASLSARGFLPLYEAPTPDGRNVFSAYLTGFAVLDWAAGPEIPQNIRQSTGGRSIRSAPGGSIRGYETGRFDSTVKAIANVEVRAGLPAIARPLIVPGLVLYTDAGLFFDEESTSPIDAENSGTLISSGAGFSLDLFDVFSLVFYTNLLWNRTNVEGDRWVPFALGFGFHY